MADDFDPYRILGLPVGADQAAIRRRYRALVRKHHPDVSADAEKAHERFVRIQQAYRALLDPEERARWERRSGAASADTPFEVVERPGTQVAHLMAEARLLLRQRKLRRAQEAVARAIELNPLSGEAYRLLGDIYLAGGKTQIAFEMYEEAKLLEARPQAHRQQPSDPVRPPGEREPPAPRTARAPVLAVGLIGAGTCLVVMLLTSFRSAPLSFAAWGAAAAFLLGAAGAASGLLEPVDELLGLAGVREPGRPSTPGALYLIVLSLVSPYLGLAYFIVASLVTESPAGSVLKVYAATFAITMLAWLSARGEAGAYFALVAPNIAFAATLGGWVAGSFVSPGEWWRR